MMAILTVALLIWISIDSFGSKRIRRKVIEVGKQNFHLGINEENQDFLLGQSQQLPSPIRQYLEQSQAIKALPLQTTRLRFKGVQKRQDRKRWTPIEAKIFLTAHPLSLAYYDDRTLGLFLSGKKVQILEQENASSQYTIGSIFPLSSTPQGKPSHESLAQILAHAPWVADIFLLPHWEWLDQSKNQISGIFKWQEEELKVSYRFDKKGLIKSFLTRIPAQEALQNTTIDMECHFFDYKLLDSYQVPSKYQILRSSGKKPGTIAKFDITELVQSNAFAWW